MFERTQAERSANVLSGKGSPAATSFESTPNLASERPSGSSAASRRVSTERRAQRSWADRAPGSFMTALYSRDTSASSSSLTFAFYSFTFPALQGQEEEADEQRRVLSRPPP